MNDLIFGSIKEFLEKEKSSYWWSGGV